MAMTITLFIAQNVQSIKNNKVMKEYTDIEQSKKLAEILPLESADIHFQAYYDSKNNLRYIPRFSSTFIPFKVDIPAWSLGALLKYLSEIKPQVYTPVLFPSEGKWILQFAEYGHGNVCEVSCDNSIDACHEVILKLHELKML